MEFQKKVIWLSKEHPIVNYLSDSSNHFRLGPRVFDRHLTRNICIQQRGSRYGCQRRGYAVVVLWVVASMPQYSLPEYGVGALTIALDKCRSTELGVRIIRPNTRETQESLPQVRVTATGSNQDGEACSMWLQLIGPLVQPGVRIGGVSSGREEKREARVVE